MPRMSDEHMAARRQQILDAARECFIAKGFHRATMQEVLTKADLSAGAVYNHFSGKQDIVTAIVDQSVVDAEATYEANRAAASARPLRRIFEKYVMASLRDPHMLRECILNIDGVAEGARNPKLRSLIQGDFNIGVLQLARTAEAGQASGEVSKDLDPTQLGQILSALYLGFLCLRLLDSELDTDALSDTFWAIVEGSLDSPASNARPE